MREGWVETTLGDVSSVISGGTPSTQVPEYWGGDIVWTTPTEVVASNGGVITTSSRRLSTTGLANSSAKMLPPGAVLLTSRATIGAVALAGVPLCTNQGFASLVCGPSVLPKFLLYWCTANTAEFTSRASGNTFPEISRSKVAGVPIVLPPLEEQWRIVDLIESVDAYSAALRRQAEDLSASRTLLLNGFITTAADVEVLPLGRICGIAASLVDPTLRCHANLPHIGIERIESGTGRLLPLQSAADDGVTSAKFLFSSEDVIYSKIRPELRKVAFPRFTGLASADAYPLRANGLSTAEFLYFLLQSEVFCSSAIARSGRTKMPKVNREELFSIDVPVPSLGDQHRIAALLASVDEVIAATHATLLSVQQLRAALLGQLLSGSHEIPASYDGILVGA